MLVKAAPKRTSFNAVNDLLVIERISIRILNVYNNLLEQRVGFVIDANIF